MIADLLTFFTNGLFKRYQQKADEEQDKINLALARTKENNEERRRLDQIKIELATLEKIEPESSEKVELLRKAISEKEYWLDKGFKDKPL